MTTIPLFKRQYYFYSLLLGLVSAQIIATVHVYSSNIGLYANLAHIQKAGYLAIPNQHVMPGLQSFGPAFLGGLFFTFSIGAGLGLIALAAVWIWDRLAQRSKSVLILLLTLWAGLLVAVNINGVNVYAALYFFCIPLTVFITAIKLMPPAPNQSNRRYKILHLIPILLLAFFWATQVDREVFVDLRDSLLLSNPIGIKASNFYYRYTLYPAEAFKPLHQKMLKTCTLQTKGDERIRRRLENKLLANDYLPVPEKTAADLEIIQKENLLRLEHDNKKILAVPIDDFLSQPEVTLSAFSQSIDRNTFLRTFTFLSLLIGFPIAFFMITHSLITNLFALFLEPGKSAVCATVLFLFIGLGLLVPLHIYRNSQAGEDDLDKALYSEQWQERIAALKIIGQKEMDISRFDAYPKLLDSRNAAERYWLVRAIGADRSSNVDNDLFKFLNDPQLNVRTMAFYALGQQKKTNAKKVILDRIKNSHDWYDQWYAYNALRSLGWKQKKSP